MRNNQTELQRLLPVRWIVDLERSFQTRPGEGFFWIFDREGNLYYRPAGWMVSGLQEGQENLDRLPESFLAELPAENSDRPFIFGGLAFYTLTEKSRTVGFLAAREPAAWFYPLRTSLNLLIGERSEKRDLSRETLDRYREVNLLYRIADTIGSSLDPAIILGHALEEARRVIASSFGCIARTSPDQQVFVADQFFGNPAYAQEVLQIIQHSNPLDGTLQAGVILSGLAGSGFKTDSLLVCRLFCRDQTYGLICLARGVGEKDYTASDKKLLTALAGQAAGALDTAWRHQREMENRRIEQEVDLSQRIQQSLLPASLPDLPGWQFSASYQAARQVGGDFYDVLSLHPGGSQENGGQRVGMAIADVTGKGFPAALMMAFSQSTLRAIAPLQTDPSGVLTAVNRSILTNSSTGMMVTLFYAILDPLSNRMVYSNAGHEAPFWYQHRRGICEPLDGSPGVLLGADRGWSFTDCQVELGIEDVLVFYTDGIPEARNPQGEFFTEERLRAAIMGSAGADSQLIVAEIERAVRDFTQDTPPSDDRTLLVVKRTG